MKTFNLSLAAIAAMSIVSTTNASSLEEALKNGKISGAIQAYNFSRNLDTGKDYQITTLNLDLSYETARINGFGAKATFQAASSPWADDDAKAARSGDMYGSGAQLSELYLSYKTDNTTAQIGRMYFWSPLLGGSGSRPTKEAMQGISIVNSDIPDTTVTLAYMNKMQSRTDGEGNIGKFTKKFTGWDGSRLEDGVYTVALTNKSIKDLTLTVAYLNAIDNYETAYLEGSYDFGSFALSSQYYYSEQENEEDTNLLGVKATTSIGSLDLLAAYVTVDDDNGVIPGAGNGADLAYTWSEIFANQYRADQDSYKLAATYNINKDAYVGVSYVNEDDKMNDKEYGYTAIKASYNFSGELSGLNIWAAYEMGSQDAKDDGLRIKLNYTF